MPKDDQDGRSRSEVRIKSVEESLKQMSNQINTLLDKSNSIEKTLENQNRILINQEEAMGEIKKLRESLNSVLSENQFLKTKIKELESQMDSAFIQKNRNLVEISGVPENANILPEDLIIALAEKAKVKCQKHEIKRTQKIKSKNNRQGTIRVKFYDVALRDRFLKEVKKSRPKPKDINLKGDDNIYVNEVLSFKTKKIFYLAKQLVREKNWFKAWIFAGYTYIKLESQSNPVKIESIEDLEVISK